MSTPDTPTTHHCTLFRRQRWRGAAIWGMMFAGQRHSRGQQEEEKGEEEESWLQPTAHSSAESIAVSRITMLPGKSGEGPLFCPGGQMQVRGNCQLDLFRCLGLVPRFAAHASHTLMETRMCAAAGLAVGRFRPQPQGAS